MIQGNVVRQAMFRVAGVEFNDLENLIVLNAFTSNVNKYSTPRLQFATAGYQVTAGKTLYLLAMRVKILAAGSALHQALLGYGDTDVGFDAAAGPTNALYPAGISACGPISGIAPTAATGGGNELPLALKIPAGKYLYVFTDSNATWGATALFTFYGYEK